MKLNPITVPVELINQILKDAGLSPNALDEFDAADRCLAIYGSRNELGQLMRIIDSYAASGNVKPDWKLTAASMLGRMRLAASADPTFAVSLICGRSSHGPSSSN